MRELALVRHRRPCIVEQIPIELSRAAVTHTIILSDLTQETVYQKPILRGILYRKRLTRTERIYSNGFSKLNQNNKEAVGKASDQATIRKKKKETQLLVDSEEAET